MAAKRRRKHKRARRNPTNPATNPRRRRAKRRTHARRRTSRARTIIIAQNPRRRHKRRNPAAVANPQRRRVASRGKGQHRKARTYRLRSKHGRKLGYVRGWRTRKANPGMAGIIAAGIGLASGFGASVLASYGLNKFAPTASNTTHTLVLVGLAAGAGFLIGNPAVAAGIATGLLITPAAQALYTAVPSLANPTPVTATVVPMVAPAPASAPMGALRHFPKPLRLGIGSLHRSLGSLHRAPNMGALYSLGSLHRAPGLGALQNHNQNAGYQRGVRPGQTASHHLSRVFSNR